MNEVLKTHGEAIRAARAWARQFGGGLVNKDIAAIAALGAEVERLEAENAALRVERDDTRGLWQRECAAHNRLRGATQVETGPEWTRALTERVDALEAAHRKCSKCGERYYAQFGRRIYCYACGAVTVLEEQKA